MAQAQRPDLLQAASDGNDLSVFQELTEDGDIDYYKDRDGNTLLSLAARNGHKDPLNLLLAKGAKINAQNSDGKTPLAYAAENGHQEIVELLLKSQTRSDRELYHEAIFAAVLSAAAGGHKSLLGHLIQTYMSHHGLQHQEIQEVFHRAVAASHAEVLKLWLAEYKYNVDINERDNSGNTALYRAIQAYNKDVVAVLLEREEIDINAQSGDGSAIAVALASSYEDLADMLYARDRTGGGKRCTALHHAISNEDKKTVKWLLQKDGIDVNAKDLHDFTPLHTASRYGRTEMASLLLARNDIMVNVTARINVFSDQTPLHMAAENGHTEIVKLLLARSDIIVNAVAGFDGTPLHMAAENGHTEIVKLVLARSDIIINGENHNKQTPLHLATGNSHTDIVKLLLARSDIIINGENDNKQTPLHLATENSHTDIVKLLLASKEVNVNATASFNETPLHIAAHEGNTELVRLLLETDGINVNAIADDDETPISLAFRERQKDVITLLLRSDDLDLNPPGFRSGDLLHWATETGQREMVDLVLARKSNAYTNRTLLTRYSENGYTKALECLLKTDGIDVNSKDSGGRTPLSRAAEKGHGRVVEMLLQNGADSNFKGSDGRTPLSRAAEKGHDRVVEILLQYGADGKFKDSDGRTPLWQAAGNGHEEVVKQLAPDDTTALLLLVKEGKNRAIDLVLRYTPNLEQKNDRGQSALHLAVLLGYQDIARALMLKGVNVNSKDDYDMTPLQLAMQRNYGDLIQELLARGASPEGIMGKEWRDAFGKRNEDVVRLSKGHGGDYYVDFPTEILAGEEILQTSNRTKSRL